MRSNVSPSRGRLVLAAIFLGAGVLHFVMPHPFERIVPSWIPNAPMAVALSGVAEILGGAGLLIPSVRGAAGIGLMLLLIAVFPANIEMLTQARADHASALWQTALWLRLPLQPLLVWWVWRSR